MLGWLRRSARPSAAPAADPELELLRSLSRRVSAPERAASVLSRLAAFERLDGAGRRRELPAVYLLFERYLVELDANPTSRAALRAEVRGGYPGLLEEPGFALLFESAATQEVRLCGLMLRHVLRRAAELLGSAPGQSLGSLLAWCEALPRESGGRVPLLEEEFAGGPEAEWVTLLYRVSGALFRHLEQALGERTAARVYEAAYTELLDAYSALDAFSVVVGMLPERLLDEEKIVLLSRRQVHRVVLDQVERLQRANEALRSAQEDLEARIVERTEELRRSNEELRREVEERQRAEVALRAGEERFRTVVESMEEGLLITDLEDRILYANAAMARITGYEVEELLGQPADELLLEESVRQEMATRHERRREGGSERYELRMRRKDGRIIDVEITGTPYRDAEGSVVGTLGAATDVTERRKLEAQLRQSQKMEAVGRLAGGVAHDFNNLLTIIASHLEFLLEEIPLGTPLRDDAEGIGAAAERASALTRQLLAFSRKQVLQPKVLDLNQTVGEMEKMFRRVLGEDVALATVTDAALGRVKADPGQIAQVLLNLAVNARDAMPDGGKLTIETANVELDEAYARGKVDLRSGPYIMLAVSDTGCGMDEATRARIFEPFFTTKEPGKGTGLGLSTVYGIVQQSGGHVWVYSEPGRGTTFKVYLPRVDLEVEAAPAAAAVPVGREVVLLVEDEPTVRLLARRTLQRAGYQVIEAEKGETGLRLAAEHAGPIDLLLTDVVMPGGGGRELAERLLADRPDTRVLYMSGYTDDAVLRHGLLEAGVRFLEKPFTPSGLLRKVREVLDESNQLSVIGYQ